MRGARARASAVVWILASLLAIEACTDGKARLQAATLQLAVNAYTNLNLEEARDGFKRVLRDESIGAEDRAEAARSLAAIAWRFDKRPAESLSFLRWAEELGLERTKVLYEEARIQHALGDYSNARLSALKALEAAVLRSDRVAAATLFARCVIEEVMQSEGPDQESRHLENLAKVRDLMGELLEHEPGLLDASRWLLAASLKIGDGTSALKGWRSYYWILPSGNPQVSVLERNEAILARELARWGPGPRPVDLNRTVVRALADSGFHRLAAWIARMDDAADMDRDTRGIVAYGEFLDRVEQLTNQYYRLHSIGRGSKRAFREEFDQAAQKLWDGMPWHGDVPSFSESRLIEEIKNRFGASVKFEPHDGALCLHLGFSLIDKEYSVEQYGYRAKLRFRVLDHMISNGYNSWFWDGSASSGGWVDRQGSIVQVRPAYAEGPLRAWRQVRLPDEKRKLEEEMEEKSRRDDEIAASNPYAYLPGLALRLRNRGYRRILAELESRITVEHDLRDAFTREVARRVHASSILAHEGRHAIDKRGTLSFLRPHAEKEYRAKLSEVALAPDPGLALTGGILFPNVGGSSSHGQANERIVKTYVEWMRSHQNEIEGLDLTRPYLPQLDLLTDDQLRAALREVDPLAN